MLFSSMHIGKHVTKTLQKKYILVNSATQKNNTQNHVKTVRHMFSFEK